MPGRRGEVGVSQSFNRYPGPSNLLSGLAILAGVAVCVFLVPDVIYEPEDLRWAAIALAIGLALGPLVRALRRPESVLHPTSVLLFALIYWLLLDIMQAMYVPEVHEAQAVRAAFIAVALFAIGICAAALFPLVSLPKALRETAQRQIRARSLFVIGVVAFLIAFLRFAVPSNFDLLRMYEALFQSRWTAPWARGAFGGWDAFLDHLAYFGYILPALTVLVLRAEQRVTMRSAALGMFALVITLLLAQGGGRRIVGALVASAGVAWILTARKKGRTLIAALLFGMPALLLYLQFMLFSRVQGIAAAPNVSIGELMAGGVRVDDNFNRLAQTIEIVPRDAPHIGTEWLLWVLARPIPRVFWPGKPEGLSFDLPQYLGIQGTSLSSSIVGESYLAFGFLGCLLTGLVFGYIGRWIAPLLKYPANAGAVLLAALSLLALFVGVRSAIEAVLFSYAILVWIVLSQFIARHARGKA